MVPSSKPRRDDELLLTINAKGFGLVMTMMTIVLLALAICAVILNRPIDVAAKAKPLAHFRATVLEVGRRDESCQRIRRNRLNEYQSQQVAKVKQEIWVRKENGDETRLSFLNQEVEVRAGHVLDIFTLKDKVEYIVNRSMDNTLTCIYGYTGAPFMPFYLLVPLALVVGFAMAIPFLNVCGMFFVAKDLIFSKQSPVKQLAIIDFMIGLAVTVFISGLTLKGIINGNNIIAYILGYGICLTAYKLVFGLTMYRRDRQWRRYYMSEVRAYL